MVQFHTVTGPAHWASALINGDQSSLTTKEVIQLNAWRKREGIIAVCGTTKDEERFTKSMRVHCPELDCSGGNVLDYIVELKA